MDGDVKGPDSIIESNSGFGCAGAVDACSGWNVDKAEAGCWRQHKIVVLNHGYIRRDSMFSPRYRHSKVAEPPDCVEERSKRASIRSFNSATWEMILTSRPACCRSFRARIAKSSDSDPVFRILHRRKWHRVGYPQCRSIERHQKGPVPGERCEE